MQIRQAVDGHELKLVLEGRFDHTTRHTFRSVTEHVLSEQNIDEIHVDLDSVNYLDSSALGMLLVLRDKAGALNRSVVLSGAKGTVKKSLDTANFARLFRIN